MAFIASDLYESSMINDQFQFASRPPFLDRRPIPLRGEAKALEVLLSLIRRLVTSLHLPCLPVVISPGRRAPVSDSDRKSSIESLISSGTIADEVSNCSRAPSAGSTVMALLHPNRPFHLLAYCYLPYTWILCSPSKAIVSDATWAYWTSNNSSLFCFVHYWRERSYNLQACHLKLY